MSEFQTTETAASTGVESNLVVRRWDPTDGPVGSILDAVTHATDTDANELPALYDVIDPDALTAIVAPDARSERDRTSRSVTFVYGGCEVTVEATGRTVASPIADD